VTDNKKFSVPFKEEDFHEENEKFEVLERISYEVMFAQSDLNYEKFFTRNLKTGRGDPFEFAEVSEQDRPFIKKGSKMTHVHGRRTGARHGRTSFWVLTWWPGKDQK